jgi:hypothetical protein
MIVIATIVMFGIIVLAMAIGVLFKGRCIRGSCGGEAIYDADGELLNCDSCPVRRDKERVSREADGGTRVPASRQS